MFRWVSVGVCIARIQGNLTVLVLLAIALTNNIVGYSVGVVMTMIITIILKNNNIAADYSYN